MDRVWTRSRPTWGHQDPCGPAQAPGTTWAWPAASQAAPCPPPGVSNEAKFVFTIQSIVMAQKLKGTLSFIAKVPVLSLPGMGATAQGPCTHREPLPAGRRRGHAREAGLPAALQLQLLPGHHALLQVRRASQPAGALPAQPWRCSPGLMSRGPQAFGLRGLASSWASAPQVFLVQGSGPGALPKLPSSPFYFV